MPYLTNLAQIARDAGLTVVELSGWKTDGHGPMTDVQTVTCHHTAGSASGDAPSLGVVKDGRPDLDGPLAHYVLSRSGIVYVVAAGVCWHTGATREAWQGNYHSVGIEAEATGTAPWPPAQIEAYAKLCAALCRAFRLPVSRVLGHKEVCYPPGRKSDPNFDMGWFRGLVQNVLNGNPVVTPTRKEEAMLTPQALPYSGEGETLAFPVESSGNSGIMAHVWFRIGNCWGGSCEYEVNFVNAAGQVVAPTAGDSNVGSGGKAKTSGTLSNNQWAYWELPADCTMIGLRYKNLNPENRVGISFPQKEK